MPVVVCLTAGLAIGASATLGAQGPPPTTSKSPVLEGTMKAVYRATNVVVVATLDGVEHMYHFTKDLLVHGGKGTGVDALEGLEEGTTVVIHSAGTGADQSAVEIDRVGDEGLKTTEGVVTKIDHKRLEITIRFDNGTKETLQLTARAAAEAGSATSQAVPSTRVVVYYADEDGRKVAHYFKKVSR